ncbi:sensor histidine kinase [Paenarthrobacter nitroguajacolicus]|uniref:sensor histidine kinase n=1 Tax=Paenarthrobacter nitroguajacolicus TaxID=211146 RepID=UPI00342713B8
MQSLVDDLLLLARSGSPDFIKREWVDVDSFLAESMDRIKIMADRRWQIDDMPSGRLWADRNLLSQVVDRLAANAVQSTTHRDVISLGAAWVGSPSINASSGHEQNSASTIEIWVADSGCGISAEDQERIFDPFNKVGVPRERLGEGLGLAIVKAIVVAHQGSIRVNSRLNVGSRFVLSLPEESGKGSDQTANTAQPPRFDASRPRQGFP